MGLLSRNELKLKIPDIDRLIQLMKDVKTFKERIISKGDLAEFYCEKLFGIERKGLPWNEKFDGFLPDGSPVEVRQREDKTSFPFNVNITLNKKSQQLLNLESIKIAYLFLVYFNENLIPKEIYKIPIDEKSIKWTKLTENRDKKRIDVSHYTSDKKYLVYEDDS